MWRNETRETDMSEESLPYGESPDAAESVDFAERAQRLLVGYHQAAVPER